jgi:PIN domain nuclease of toxin-antitoxin system
MKLLLDTHTFLWFIMGSSKLSKKARELMEDVNNERLLSIASLWEMAIKASLGKLTLAAPFEVLIPQ